MPTIPASRSNVTWGNRTAGNVLVERLADTAENRKKLQEQASKDQLPSVVVDFGQDVALLSSGALQTASKIARVQGPSIAKGDHVKVDEADADVLFTDDGFSEIKADDVVVAVIDSGLDVNHPAFKGRVVKPYNTMTGTSDVTDTNSHGTHCAGIIAGAWGLQDGAGGVAPQVKIMPVKAGNGTFTLDDIVKGIRYAADNGAKVISMSLGGGGSMPEVQRAVQYALSKGCVVVAAAGNDGQNTISYPGRYDDILSIGSSKDGRRSSFSNGGDRLDLSAPGENILSTVPGGYGKKSGTSMATPYAAGAIALVMARHPEWTPDQVKAHMKKAVNDLGAPGKDKDFGYGEINLFKAVYGENLPDVPAPVTPSKPEGFFARLLRFLGLKQ
jgi:subtilisin family serine protease